MTLYAQTIKERKYDTIHSNQLLVHSNSLIYIRACSRMYEPRRSDSDLAQGEAERNPG